MASVGGGDDGVEGDGVDDGPRRELGVVDVEGECASRGRRDCDPSVVSIEGKALATGEDDLLGGPGEGARQEKG